MTMSNDNFPTMTVYDWLKAAEIEFRLVIVKISLPSQRPCFGICDSLLDDRSYTRPFFSSCKVINQGVVGVNLCRNVHSGTEVVDENEKRNGLNVILRKHQQKLNVDGAGLSQCVLVCLCWSRNPLATLCCPKKKHRMRGACATAPCNCATLCHMLFESP